jgi:hypothetical protein
MKIEISGIPGVKRQLTDAMNAAKARKSKILADVVRRLQKATPVDTGRARDGWVIDKGNIVNNVPYISDLNAGHSQQAPSHFVEKVILQEPNVTPNGVIVTYR